MDFYNKCANYYLSFCIFDSYVGKEEAEEVSDVILLGSQFSTRLHLIRQK